MDPDRLEAMNRRIAPLLVTALAGAYAVLIRQRVLT
jgi:hypothetical protein